MNGIHAERLKEIRRFVSFNYDLRKPLSQYEKRKIKRYYEEISAITNRPGETRVYRARRQDHRETVQAAVGMDKSLSELKTVPITAAEKTAVEFSGKKLKFKTEHVTKEFHPATPEELIANVRGLTNRILADAPGAKSFSPASNSMETRKSASRSKLFQTLMFILNVYDPSLSIWFNGVWAYYFKRQADFDEYKAAFADAQKKRKRRKRAA